MAYTHSDVIDWAAGVAAVPEVAAATAQRHDRAHSLTSSADHLDVFASAPIMPGSVLQWQASTSRWVPVVLSATEGGGYAQTMMLMGG
jgi:valyl-tRNA synthetase